MTYTLTIPGTLPGLNEYIAAERTNRFKAAKMKRESEDKIMHWANIQLRGVKFKRPVTMAYLWVEPSRRRDKSNISGYGRKVIEDALVKSDILENDGWAQIAGFSDTFEANKKYPRIEVTITELP